MYKIIYSTADIGIYAEGKTLDKVFKESLKGFYSIITDLETIEEKYSIQISLSANNKEELLINWLSELIFRFDVDGFLCNSVSFEDINETSLTACLWGERYSSAKHPLRVEVKAVTYHNLSLEYIDGIWWCSVLLDI